MTTLMGMTGVQRVMINAATADAEIIAAHASKAIRVISMVAYGASGTFQLKTDDTNGDVVFPSMGATVSAFVLPPKTNGWFETNAAEALYMDLSGAVAHSLLIEYIYI